MDMAITNQPGTAFGFPKNDNPDNVAGLACLASITGLTIKQRWPGCLELLECWEYTNKYDVMDDSGNPIFFMKEESHCCARYCFGKARPLEVSFQDLQGQELLRFARPLRCMECPCSGFYPNWTQNLTIHHQGQKLGEVREVPVCCTRKHLEVWNKNEEKLYDISGPCIPFACGSDIPFPIEDQAGTGVGEIIKKWRGWGAEALTDVDTFKIAFPDNIDVTTKAILMGATMLVDYMYFEKTKNNNN